MRRCPRSSLPEGFFQPLPVHGCEVEQGLRLAVGDQVFLGCDGLIEELLNPAQNTRDVRALGVGGDTIGEELSNCTHPAELISPLVGKNRLVQAIHERGAGQERGLLVIVHHQHLDRAFPGRDQVESPQAAERIEVYVPLRAEGPAGH